MARVKKILAWVCFLQLCICESSFGQGHCLLVSDMHFNPFYTKDGQHNIDPGLMDSLTKADPAKWSSIFNNYYKSAGPNTGITRGYDSNYNLVATAMNSMAAAVPNPDFIVISGDFIWHSDYNGNLQVKFKSPQQEALLKIKTMAYIAGLFHQKFPGVPVIPALGNNDSDKGDYMFPTDVFLNAFADDWKLKNVPGSIFKVNMTRFKAGGYYTAHYNDLKFLVLNTTLLSKNSPDNNNKQDSLMFQWLRTELANPGQKIWIVSHIPPGNDMPLNYTTQLATIVKDHARNVQFYIAAHTHFNDFRVIYNNGPGGNKIPRAYVRMMPSIGPNHSNSPGFINAEYGADGKILKETQYYLDLNDYKWKSNYGIGTVGLPKISAAGMLEYMLIKKNPKTTPGYYQFHSLDRTNRDSYLDTTFNSNLLKASD